jgi:amidohydrolase
MDAKAASRRVVEGAGEALVELSHLIHANPELCFEEEKSAAWVAGALSDGGFAVEAGVCDLPTAFTATVGSGPLHIGICAEYDALPGIGHACGHNIIAAAAVGAGLALAEIADEVGLTVTVLGTPAEEGGGGKILMLDRGAFDGLHAAMMVHPAPFEREHMPCLAVSHIDVHYTGKEAHASAFPELGVNAADALTVAQVAIGLNRQHLRRGDQVHGIVTNGGDAPNIVPGHTSGKWYLRAPTLKDLARLEPKIHRCFEAGALATGAELRIEEKAPPYSEFTHDAEIAAVYQSNAEALGREFPDMSAATMGGSTDMANVSLVMPTIHPMLGIGSFPAVNHQPEFTAHCVKSEADKAVIDGAIAMAWTAIDLATTDALRTRLTTRSFVS